MAVVATANVPFTPPLGCAQAAAGSTCRLTMDVVRPSFGGPWPVLVLFPGGPADPGSADYLLPFATALAGQGNVVMDVQWRQSTAYGGGFATSFQDAACAIGVARATAGKYGGNAQSVTAVGHSLGGWAAAVVGLTPGPFWPAAGACNPVAGSLRPDAIVDIDGATDEPVTMEDGEPYVTQFFGGTPDTQPDAYAAADVLQIIKGNPAPEDPPPILLVHATEDVVVSPSVSTTLHAALQAAGYPNQLLLIPGGHTAALSSDQVVASIAALAR